MRFRPTRSPFSTCAAATIVAALILTPTPASARPFSAALLAADGEGRSPAYRDAQSALDQAQWDEAARRFAAVAEQKNADSDAATYWKAYAEEKLGRRSEALQTLKSLRLSYPKSVWLDDADALEIALTGSAPRSGRPVIAGPSTSGSRTAGAVIAGGGAAAEEDLQLYALDGLMQMDSARALPILEKILAGNRSLQVKQRALFVLSQSDEPRARTLLVETARAGKPAELQLDAVRSLGIAGDPEDIRALSEIYRSSPAQETRAAILEAFLIAGEEKPILEAARTESDPQLRGKAIQLLGALDATAALGDLYKSDSSPGVKSRILEGMMIAGDRKQLLAAARNEPDRELRGEAIELLGAAGGDEELVELYAATPDQELRGKIIQGLMIAGNGKAMIGLLRQEKDPELKKTIVQHLSLMDDDEAMAEIERLLTEKP
ncbi:MAG: HEAT repeat domain-containing protein [Thermoanaerobaculia bacterium]